jgi:hypothetical protein
MKTHTRLLPLVATLVVLAGHAAETTTADNLAPTPQPPYAWPVFKEGFRHGDNSFPAYSAAQYAGTSIGSAPAAGCPTSVVSLRVLTTGKVDGNLSYHTAPRRSGTMPETNDGNTDLGGVYKKYGPVENWAFKFEVVIEFQGPLGNAFYGQLMSNSLAPNAPAPVFGDDTPQNDWIGKSWDVPAGKSKSDFPVVEVSGNTVRWIDAPQGTSRGNTKSYAILYAGACGKVTHTAILRLDFPSGGAPTARILSDAQFAAEAGSFTYATGDVSTGTGGGAPSLWFLAALAVLVAVRLTFQFRNAGSRPGPGGKR